MRPTLTPLTPPATEPVTLAEAKLWAKVDSDADDALVTSLIAAARQAAENFTRRSFITQTWRLGLDPACSGRANGLPEGVYDLPVSVLSGELPRVLDLPKGPVQSVTAVVTFDANNAQAAFDAGNYALDAAGDRLYLNASAYWPSNLRHLDACRVTYVAGYGSTAGDVPQPIRTAILMHVQAMYDGRIVCDLPAGCEQLLRQYRRHGPL